MKNSFKTFLLFLLFLNSCKEDDTTTIYLTELEESFISFSVSDSLVLEDSLQSQQMIFVTGGSVAQTFVKENETTFREVKSIHYSIIYPPQPPYMNPVSSCELSVRHNKLTFYFPTSVPGPDVYSLYELLINEATTDLDSLVFINKHFYDVYIITPPSTNTGYFNGDLYFTKAEGLVAIGWGNHFIYLH